MPDVKDIVDELDAVCSDIKVIAPPLIEAGKDVIADNELLFAKLRAMLCSYQCYCLFHKQRIS